MSAPCSPAARLAMMLPTAHAIAAPITSAKPISGAGEAARELVPREHDHPGGGDRGADQVVPVEVVAGERDGEADREEHLHLDHERRESRRHPELEPEEQEAELADADREAVQRRRRATASPAAG